MVKVKRSEEEQTNKQTKKKKYHIWHIKTQRDDEGKEMKNNILYSFFFLSWIEIQPK